MSINLRTSMFTTSIVLALAGMIFGCVGMYAQFGPFKSMGVAFLLSGIVVYAVICVADRKRLTADDVFGDRVFFEALGDFGCDFNQDDRAVEVELAEETMRDRLDELLGNRKEAAND